ncbi:MAG: BamA/TamA family outer membrane protein [candidate division WOR-3 bacterium]|nr:MAG: BamA/TamA family outer membrane protein [candidate division WOR-3 bacterium]
MIYSLIIIFVFNTQILDIGFVGNKAIGTKELIQEIISKKGETYNDMNLTYDAQKIVNLYSSRGYFNTDVFFTTEIINGGVDIVFTITEGERPVIKEIIVKGDEQENVKNQCTVEVNDFFIQEKMSETEKKIEDYYKDRGYPFAEVSSLPLPDSGLLVLSIEKGVLHYIRNIEIGGLKTTNPQIVRREIEFKRGDLFNKSKLRYSQRRIYGLGFFSTVNVEIVRDEPDSVDLVFTVRELKSRLLNFGAGLTIPLSFLFSFGDEELNLLNTGHHMHIRPSFKINIESEWEIKLEGRYTIPHLTPARLTVSVLPFMWFEEKVDFTRQTRGNEFRVAKIYNENLQFSIAHQYKFVDLQPKTVLPDTFQGVTNGVKFQFMVDYREEFFNPSEGVYLLPLFEYAGGIFRGDNHFVRMSVEERLYIPLFKNTFAQRLKLGFIQPTDGLAPYEKYYLGGQYTLRGYPERSLGPDSIGEERYGNIVANLNCEYRIAFPKNFGFVLFFDIGYVDNTINIHHTDFIKVGTGFGLRYYTPIGPVRCDIGFPIGEKGNEIYVGLYHIF